jgi:hypothetical protein
MTDTSAGSREERVLLGRWGTPLIVFSVAGVLGSFVFSWGWIANDLPTPPTDMLVTLLPLFLMVSVLTLLASARIVGGSSGYVEVIGLFVKHRIPVAEIAEVEPRGPLKIRTTAGRRIGSIAYGQSLIGEAAGYSRSRKTAERIEAFCAQVERDGHGRDAMGYSVRLRTGEILVALLLGVVLVTVTITRNQV